ncbi:MAG TPA: NAD(P)-binding domain-containing protein [Ktedonobacterales bacterium]|nr:NAD(P)-binding domain-containing protein [Ktedonobacterales bacterium]
MSNRTSHYETIIIGGGQAGLATSYCLTERNRPHLVLEQAARPAHVWSSERWDSFTLVTPNWSILLPGATYDEDAPEAFMPRDALVSYLDHYVARFRPPVRYGVRVSTVEGESAPTRPSVRYTVRAKSADGEPLTFTAANVVVATGIDQQPKIPVYADALPTSIHQIHSSAYRNPSALPEGAVLVVGSAQSGSQIAEELYQRGHRVYLCVGSAGRAPRRYRGDDIFRWLIRTGFFDRPAEQLPSPQARFEGPPHISGTRGGHTLNLHQFARDGVALLGRLQGAHDGRIALAAGLHGNLAKADQFETEVCDMIDRYIEQMGLEAPREELPRLRDGYAAEEITSLDVRAAGISTVIWAAGYTFDFSLVRLPVFDDYGFPIQTHGITRIRGLYFIGLPWLHGLKSGTFVGVGEDAEWIARAIERETDKAQATQVLDVDLAR